MLLAGAGLIWERFDVDIDAAHIRVAKRRTVIETLCGAIEYREAGVWVARLALHGSGGGFDQGTAFVAPLAAKGIRVIAVSRFGDLR